MAKNKIERIDQEIAKTREKIAEQQEKLKDPQIVKQFDGLDKSRQEAVDVS